MHAVVIPFWLDRPPLEALEVAHNAERFGFRELWIGEMVTFDAFALGGAIAQATHRITLVIGPLALAVRDPAGLALGIASVSLLGKRPAHLALGASTPTVVAQWHGRAWQHAPARMRETVAALRQILAGGRAAFRGTHVCSEGFRLAAGGQASQIAVAAVGAKMLRTAAEIADRVVVNLVTPAQVRRVREAIDAGARAAGRPALPLVAWVPAALDPSEEGITQLKRQVVLYLAARGYGEMFTEAGFGDIVQRARSGAHPRETLAAIPGALIDAVCAIGDAHDVRDRVDAYRAAGADTVAIVPVTAGDPGGRRLLEALANAR
jgi:probable F420-dependent oxidoreductase